MSTSSTDTASSFLIEAIANDLIQESGDRILDFGNDAINHSDNKLSDDLMVLSSEGQNTQQLQPLKTENSSALAFDGFQQSNINFNNFAISAAENAPSEATPYSNGVVSTVTLSGSNHIDSLIDGQKWGGATGTGANLTYSFGEINTSWYAFSAYPQPGAEPWNGFSPLTDIQKNATRNALAAWSEVANLQFTEVTDSQTVAGDLRFARSNNPSTAWAYTPGSSPVAGDIWFSHSSSYDTDTKGTYGYATFLHEIGHALGLKHPHETSGSGVVADLSIDTTHNSVMSYRSYFNQPVYAGYSQGFYSTSPLLSDIAAIQYLYGANMNTRSGDSVYSWAANQQIFEAIWDVGGVDTIDWSNQTSAALINLSPGRWSRLGPAYWNGQAWESQTLAIAYNVAIENATGGSGNDTIIGNDIGNVLSSGDGNDYLDGLSGDDGLLGDAGNDTLLGWNGNDALVGGAGDDYLRGEAGNDTITGGAGADIFAFNSPWEGVDTLVDFQWQQNDKIQVSVGGFGMTTGDISRFTYDGSSLFFDSVQFAFLSNGFTPSLDIVFA